MFMIPCRVRFEGGPHDGHIAAWQSIPDNYLVVDANPNCRDLTAQPACDAPAAGRAAAYQWLDTRIIGGLSNPQFLLRYRFLSFAPANKILEPAPVEFIAVAAAVAASIDFATGLVRLVLLHWDLPRRVKLHARHRLVRPWSTGLDRDAVGGGSSTRSAIRIGSIRGG